MNKRIALDIQFTRWLFRAYLVLLFLIPLPLGSNRPLFWSLTVAAVALLALVWAVGWLLGVARWPRGMKRAQWALGALGLFSMWGGVQVVGTLVGGVAPKGALTGYLPRTVDVQGSLDSLILSVGLFLLAALTIVLVRSKRRALMVLYTLVLAGLVQAVYGSLMLLSGVEFGFLEPKEFGGGLRQGLSLIGITTLIYW